MSKVLSLFISIISTLLFLTFLISFGVGMYSIIHEDELMKEEIKNEYVDSDFLNWQRVDISSFGSFMIPEDWVLIEDAKGYLILDSQGKTLGRCGLIGHESSCFDSTTQMAQYLLNFDETEAERTYVEGIVHLTWSHIYTLSTPQTDGPWCLVLSKYNSGSPHSYFSFVFLPDNALSYSDFCHISQAIAYSYQYKTYN